MSQAPLILVDGSSYLYRAFHASFKADLRTKDGRPTGAIRVMTNMLRKLPKQYPGSTVVVVFDAKGKTFRHEMFVEYKATRKAMPDDLRPQVEPIHQIVKAMGMPLLMVGGVEADDVIGTLATQATEKKIDVVISTGDKDIAQLVSEHVTLIDTMKDEKLDLDGVQQKYGFGADLIIDYLALMGDSSDNIPGMPGVGEKTAVALLQGIGSIKQIAERLEEIPALKFRGSKTFPAKFAQHKEVVELSYQLATIKTDVELEQSIDQLEMQPVDGDKLVEIFTEFELRGLIDELERQGSVNAGASAAINNAATAPAAEKVETDYQTILSEDQLKQWVEQLKAADIFAFDTETTALDYMKAKVVGVSFAVEAGKAAYLPFGHDYIDAPEQLSEDLVWQYLKPLLESDQHKKVGQHIKYDAHVLRNHNIDLKGIAHDTMLQAYVLDSNGRHDMNTLADKYLDRQTVKFEEVAGKGVKQKTFNQIELGDDENPAAAFYAAEDADITLQLHQHLMAELEKIPTLLDVYTNIEMPLVRILEGMEYRGVLIDSERLASQTIELKKRIDELEKQAYELAGEEFNLASPKQLQVILFEKNQLPIIKKTPKGQPSTAEEVLEELAHEHELPRLILEHRSLSKLVSTYTDKLPKLVQEKTGRVHTSYHQAVTVTGRLSSSDPNLQNIPIRNAEGRKVRQAFRAEPGYVVVAADYSQVELRIMAHLSGDEGLLNAFAAGEDIHKATAAEVFGVMPMEVTDDMRRNAKAVNFGLIYGMSAFGLAKQLGIARGLAQEYINLYFERYPGVKTYMETTRQYAEEHGHVKTLSGRQLKLPGINAKNAMVRKGAERAAINAPMQGTAADIIKLAMKAVDHWLTESQLDAKMLMQVHDELVFEVAESDLKAFRQGLKPAMENAMSIDVPLLVEIGQGDSWEEAH
ncbi:DNA polymerase I [Pelagibaculum spongiae]|uniref:DNA polymerase I n=1 Tax=Pelagibaculum spongiae TaxID=2080658 RepID=A0A2V1H2N4_9GAMM|nr:DNA polymerase I [Pelagibaculum spongiae]PVZ70661.1 DNA polymerase I [Pelagibaculum spongiae]